MSESKKPKSVAHGTIQIGHLEIECHVLDDRRRVISQRGIVRAITAKPGESGGAKSGNLARYIGNLPKRFEHLASGQDLVFSHSRGGGGDGHGREATWFVDLCNAYVAAATLGELRADQLHLAANAASFVAAAAKVGVEAMVDEAAGYVPDENDTPIARFIRHLFQADPRRYAVLFKNHFVKAACQLFRIERRGNLFPAPLCGVIGKLYEIRFGKAEHAVLKYEINPPRENRNKHHQHFTSKLSELMDRDINVVLALMMSSATKDQFWELWRNYCNGGGQLRFGW